MITLYLFDSATTTTRSVVIIAQDGSKDYQYIARDRFSEKLYLGHLEAESFTENWKQQSLEVYRA
jgi:hypothetical protein